MGAGSDDDGGSSDEIIGGSNGTNRAFNGTRPGRRGRIHGRGRARTCAVGGHDASMSPGETGRTLAFERTALPLSGKHAPPSAPA